MLHAYVALLRGINVGGHNRLPMQDLKTSLESLDCRNVATYIQSGNVVFQYAGEVETLASRISGSIESQFSFRPGVLILSADDYVAILAATPYTPNDPKHLHISFLSEPATGADTRSMKTMCGETESFVLGERAFYLHAPDGIGRSKLAGAVERLLGVAATSRNYRTACKLQSMLDDLH